MLYLLILIFYYRMYLEAESLDKRKQRFDTSSFTLTNVAVSSNLVSEKFAENVLDCQCDFGFIYFMSYFCSNFYSFL